MPRGSHIEEYAGLSLVRKSKPLKCFAHYHARDLTTPVPGCKIHFQVFSVFLKTKNTLERVGSYSMELEIACCEPTWRGKEWKGEWEKCTVLTSSKNRVTVQCHTDNLITSCKSNFLRWTCNQCTYINPYKTSLVECAMCQNPINPINAAAKAVQQPNRSQSPATHPKKRKRSETEESQP